MNIRIPVALCAALACFANAGAAEPVESAVESTTVLMHLPDTTPQSIAVRACAACQAKELLVDEATRFFVGKQAVTLDVLRKSAEINANMYVFYDARQKVITRIKLDAVLDPAIAATPAKRRGK